MIGISYPRGKDVPPLPRASPSRNGLRGELNDIEAVTQVAHQPSSEGGKLRVTKRCRNPQ